MMCRWTIRAKIKTGTVVTTPTAAICPQNVPIGVRRLGVATGSVARVGFRPEAVEISDSAPHGIDCEIAQVSYLGDTEQYLLKTPAGTAIKAVEQNPLNVRRRGTRLRVGLRPESLFIVPEE